MTGKDSSANEDGCNAPLALGRVNSTLQGFRSKRRFEAFSVYRPLFMRAIGLKPKGSAEALFEGR